MTVDELSRDPHRRFNPLNGEWVLVSPHRTQRPWQGQVERTAESAAITFDPKCYLCPGVERAGGARNPDYKGTFVFDNDFAALKSEVTPSQFSSGDGALLRAETERGVCRVLCFSPRHDLTLSRMRIPDISAVVDQWSAEYAESGAASHINYVQIFENRGEAMGCSNPHPHCQIWSTEHIPNEPQREQQQQQSYLSSHGRCLLCGYLQLEQGLLERVVCENDQFIALVPFWAVWPFETLILSKAHIRDITVLDQHARSALADILKRITTRYDNLFLSPFPYSMGFHQGPTDGDPHPEWHFHAHFYPPLLRSATVRKFMVGFEMLGTPQRDITPEAAAAHLRGVSEVHYGQVAEVHK